MCIVNVLSCALVSRASRSTPPKTEVERLARETTCAPGGMCIVLVFTTARTGYVVPIQGVSQQEATRLVNLLTV